MTALCEILKSRIKTQGPMNIANYMVEALMHPDHGYYTQCDVFGEQGDFITAPEISQMFGEMITLSLGQAWMAQGRPKDAILVELGPGRGTLMLDMLRSAAVIPGFGQLPVHLVESSAKLRQIQVHALPQAEHHDDVLSLPNVPIFLVANEFLDALPIRQFWRTKHAWEECLVGLTGDALGFGRAEPQNFDFLRHRIKDTEPGSLIEYCPSLPHIISSISNGIKQNGGAALLIDYGDWRSKGSTLQALSDHKVVSPLDSPGEVDVTAHVDFEAVYEAVSPAVSSRLTPQGVFLERLGLTQRAKVLAKKLEGKALESHIAAHRRLSHPDEMGNLFKVIGIAPQADHLPAGLDI